MGFFFRRSSSFGPLHLNFSKSGVGASAGVKGVRLTLSPKGSTYITVGHGGFYYRQNLASGRTHSSPVPQYKAVEEQPPLEEIKTAEVEELLESSKSELVESLNKRAEMFNPATILFVLAVVFAVVGLTVFTGVASPSTQPTLPDPSVYTDTARQANRTDEYALLIARYGQPSTVTITQAGPVPLRTATYERAHLAVAFVPAGCVDSYRYYEAHKNEIAPSRGTRRHQGQSHTAVSAAPLCVPSSDKASTIVGYQDITSGSLTDYGTAERYLAGIDAKSATLPLVKTPDTAHVGKRELKGSSQVSSVDFDKGTLKGEQQRIADVDASGRKNVKIGFAFLIGALLLLVPGVVVHHKNEKKRTTRLVYELSENASEQQRVLDGTLEQLTKSRMIWRVDSQSVVTDWKRNAGASSNVERKQINVSRAVPPRVESNLVPMCVDFGKLKMFFLPDQILYLQHGTFASIEYKDLKFQSASTRFIEEQVLTSDSKQVGSTWRYVRKDGGPDLRFNNNRQLPVMLYGVITALSSGGLNLLLHTSNVAAASAFTDAFGNFQSRRDHLMFDDVAQAVNKSESKQSHGTNVSYPPTVVEAMELLGLEPGTTPEQVAVAYRHMAQMYHPDKVAGLGPELQLLAEERMKEINVAHQVVKQHLESIPVT